MTSVWQDRTGVNTLDEVVFLLIILQLFFSLAVKSTPAQNPKCIWVLQPAAVPQLVRTNYIGKI